MKDIIREKFPEIIREKLGSHVKKIILFGSRARGDYDPDKSDYDFLIIVDEASKSIKEIIFDESIKLESEYGEIISSIVWDEAESENYKCYPIGINISDQGISL